jgi:hypothetical protein
MARVSRATEITLSTPRVDFARDATPDHRSVFAFDHPTDEFMSGSAAKVGVAFENFKIGVADARADDFYQSFALAARNRAVAC